MRRRGKSGEEGVGRAKSEVTVGGKGKGNERKGMSVGVL